MAAHLQFSEHMTPAPMDDAIRRTYLGQAHIAGTGPEGKTCRECVFWHVWKYCRSKDDWVPAAPGYHGKRHEKEPLGLKKAHCNKPILNKAKRLIPHSAVACRLFEPEEKPLPAKRPEHN